MMNRKQRRDMAKKINTPQKLEELTFVALDKQKKMLLKEFERQKMELIETFAIMTAYTLNYKLGLGAKRLPKIIFHILDNIDAFNTGHLTSEDYIIIKEEMKKLGVELFDKKE